MNQTKLLQFCRSNGIALTAYSPLGSPSKLDQKSQDLYLLGDPLVKSLAKKYQRPAAHILLKYQLQRNVVVIPKAVQKAHIESNLDALSLELGHDDMLRLDSLNRNHRFLKFERCLDHKYYPFDTEF